MKKKEFNTLVKSLTVGDRLSLQKIACLTNTVKNDMINYIAGKRGAILADLLNEETDLKWLKALGYLYRYNNGHFEFLGLCEHYLHFKNQHGNGTRKKSDNGRDFSSIFL